MSKKFTVNPAVSIGHIHLTVSNLEKSLAFYKDLLGFEVTGHYGESAVFLSAGGYHHHIGLNTWAGKDATPPPLGHTGMYHFAILYPTRHELARTLKHLLDAEYPLDGASDHGVSEAIYLSDPDRNGVELYCDKPKKDWPKTDNNKLTMTTLPLDLENLLKEA